MCHRNVYALKLFPRETTGANKVRFLFIDHLKAKYIPFLSITNTKDVIH